MKKATISASLLSLALLCASVPAQAGVFSTVKRAAHLVRGTMYAAFGTGCLGYAGLLQLKKTGSLAAFGDFLDNKVWSQSTATVEAGKKIYMEKSEAVLEDFEYNNKDQFRHLKEAANLAKSAVRVANTKAVNLEGGKWAKYGSVAAGVYFWIKAFSAFDDAAQLKDKKAETEQVVVVVPAGTSLEDALEA